MNHITRHMDYGLVKEARNDDKNKSLKFLLVWVWNPWLWSVTKRFFVATAEVNKIGVGKDTVLPSLRTVRAVFPHTALQSVVSTSGLAR